MAEAQKRLREYETVFLVKPELTDENVDRLKDRFRGIVDRHGGKVLKFTVWGKKKLMFHVAKQARAIYVHAHYLGGPTLVAEVERNLRNVEEVTRYLSTKLAHEVDPDSREVQPDERLLGDLDERPAPPPEREARSGDEETPARETGA